MTDHNTSIQSFEDKQHAASLGQYTERAIKLGIAREKLKALEEFRRDYLGYNGFRSELPLKFVYHIDALMKELFGDT
jgi:hypothetical protein